ncbi:hypothetical protein JL49_17830 [Pseudoalteromonas luteoviolacea]|uniref:Uncharacterized protein n=1 Tax=Pseudoalteromonas luteoviolacea NCIMB 1942 TaxID=1365253 RepID=A0A166ZEF7_9GAMM|nr:hypothetical protein N482_16985 [Pseudoalteromonas luteoviolacea NCIMB 1942]KZW99385.1 hypothetical protein JL49_17830 [Pseudoalteromonas luteoviolacea]
MLRDVKVINLLTAQNSPMQTVIIESHDTLFCGRHSHHLPPDIDALDVAVARFSVRGRKTKYSYNGTHLLP